MEEVSVLILTYNEEKNIRKCIESILPLTDKIFIVDSGSEDKTVEICKEYGTTIESHPWTNHADQFNWGLDHFDFPSDWIMRLDADEELTEELVQSLKDFLANPPSNVTGIQVKRRMYFMGRWIKYGGFYPTWLLRMFKKGTGRCEARLMDEHIVISSGDTIRINQDIIDKNNKDLTFWTNKHNNYASCEVMDMINQDSDFSDSIVLNAKISKSQAERKRWMKTQVYARAPLFVRPFLYFIYRYFLRLGFLDGKEGLIYHFLQGFWYRFLVDAKLYEYKRQNSIKN